MRLVPHRRDADGSDIARPTNTRGHKELRNFFLVSPFAEAPRDKGGDSFAES